MARILDKDAFNRLSQAGKLGNFFKKHDSVEALRESGYNGWLTIRARQSSNSALFMPSIHSMEVTHHMKTDRRVYYQQCPAPDTARIVNLEAMPGRAQRLGDREDARLSVLYSPDSELNLRHDLERNGRDAEGLLGWMVLARYLQEDLDVLRDIWDRYPTAVIEASRFTRPVGEFHQKLIVWEVRNF